MERERGKRSVITVLGEDRTGIIATISASLSHYSANILDISQTTMEGLFVMIMLVDLTDLSCSVSELRESLKKDGKTLAMRVNVYHEDVFHVMHRI